eukprot:15438553-Alexandrium_andersonii.AAC.1
MDRPSRCLRCTGSICSGRLWVTAFPPVNWALPGGVAAPTPRCFGFHRTLPGPLPLPRAPLCDLLGGSL